MLCSLKLIFRDWVIQTLLHLSFPLVVASVSRGLRIKGRRGDRRKYPLPALTPAGLWSALITVLWIRSQLSSLSTSLPETERFLQTCHRKLGMAQAKQDKSCPGQLLSGGLSPVDASITASWSLPGLWPFQWLSSVLVSRHFPVPHKFPSLCPLQEQSLYLPLFNELNSSFECDVYSLLDFDWYA